MKRALPFLLLAVLMTAGAYAATVTPQIGGGIGQSDGGISTSGAGPVTPVLTNLRITNTGDFRITNTTDNRAVSP